MMYYDKNFIAKADLKHGSYYRGHCRNAMVARWNAEDGYFWHWRTKFTSKFLECIHHPDDELVYDVFYPHEELSDPEEEIPMEPTRNINRNTST